MNEEREEEGKGKIEFERSFARRCDGKEGEKEGKEAKIEVIVEIKPNKVKRTRGARKQSKEANKSKSKVLISNNQCWHGEKTS